MHEKTIPLQKLVIASGAVVKEPIHRERTDLHYRALFDQTGECVFIIGLDLCYRAANQQALNLLGYEEHELIGRPVIEIMSQDEQLGTVALNGDSSNLSERVLKRKDGTTLPVEVSTSIVYDDRDQPAYIQSIARDISERKQTEQLLKRQTKILSVISDATARLLQTSHIEKRIPEVLESLGEATEVSSCAIFEINTFTSNPQINIQYQWNRVGSSECDVCTALHSFLPQILNSPNEFFSSVNGQTSHASHPDVSFAIMPIHGTLGSRGYLGLFDCGKTLSWIPSARDVIRTAANLLGSALQRTRYEETIRLNEARNRTLLDTLPDLLIRIDLDGNILDYSANSNHPLYIDRDVMSGRKLAAVWPQELVEKIIGQANAGGFVKSHWLEGFRLPYSKAVYESRLHPISSKEALILIRDVTEQEKLNELKSDFINRASHELRTPLTSAILMTELIQSGGTPEELQEYWQILNSELNRQKILIERLLIAGRLESGMMRLDRVPLDLIPVLEESMRAVKPIASKKNISLNLAAQPGLARIVGDKSGLQQVFINLINNAAKFSPEGSAIKIDLQNMDDEVLVTISDQGLGIPPEALPHLFERFYRARNVTIAEIPGSGIGLYIVKTIVEELGGSIEVDSVINQGTKFFVRLRRSQSAS
jgi:PAS domain S-box-containing protein